MSRRFVLLAALIALALVSLAVAPWTLSTGGLVAKVSDHLRDQYAIDLKVNGRSTFALLPTPRVKLEGVSASAPGRSLSFENGTIRGELRLWPLIRGHIELSEIALDGSVVTLGADPVQSFDGRYNAAVAHRLEDPIAVRRLILTGSRIRWPGGGLDDVNVVATLPGGRDRLDVAGTVIWRGERLEIARTSITPSLFVAGKPSPFSLGLTLPGGKVAIDGEAQLSPDLRLTAQGRIDLRSPRDFSRWSGVDLPLGPLLRPVSISGEFSSDRKRATWPSVTLTIGDDTLEGTLSVRVDNARPAITGTLAANQIDLTDYFTPFLQARTPSGLWSGEDVDMTASTGGDLDLRLSAADASVGRLRLSDVAVSLLVRPGKVEASLGRANLNKGTVKGRLTIAGVEDVTELKAQGTFDQLDLSAYLSDLRQPRWITGTANGQFMVESTGSTPADLVRQSHGKAQITVKQGELIGVGLVDALKRVEKRPLAASTEWKGGRTAFDQAHVSLNIGAGVGEILDGSMVAANLRTALKGRVSLIERGVAIRALVDPASVAPGSSPTIVLDVTGGWDDVAIVPDVKSLIERSGAAKPLLGERPAETRSAPYATAQ